MNIDLKEELLNRDTDGFTNLNMLVILKKLIENWLNLMLLNLK